MEPERPEADELESGPLGHHLRPAGRGTQRCRSRCQRHCCRLARQAGPMRRLMVRSSPLSTPTPDRNINDNSPDISKPASSKTGNNLSRTGRLALKCGNTVNAKTICHFLPEKEILLSTFNKIKVKVQPGRQRCNWERFRSRKTFEQLCLATKVFS